MDLGNVRRLWETAYREVREVEPDLDDQILYYETNRPESHTLQGFYETYVWAIYFTGMKVSVIESKSEQIAGALQGFDVATIAAEPDEVRDELLAVFGHRKKAEAAIATAIRLNQHPADWERLQRLALEEALAELLTYPYIGNQNRYHIARNLGWDVAMTGGFSGALAASLNTTSESLVGALAKAAGKRLNTTDIILGSWSRLPCHSTQEDCIQRTRALLRARKGR